MKNGYISRFVSDTLRSSTAPSVAGSNISLTSWDISDCSDLRRTHFAVYVGEHSFCYHCIATVGNHLGAYGERECEMRKAIVATASIGYFMYHDTKEDQRAHYLGGFKKTLFQFQGAMRDRNELDYPEQDVLACYENMCYAAYKVLSAYSLSKPLIHAMPTGPHKEYYTRVYHVRTEVYQKNLREALNHDSPSLVAYSHRAYGNSPTHSGSMAGSDAPTGVIGPTLGGAWGDFAGDSRCARYDSCYSTLAEGNKTYSDKATRVHLASLYDTAGPSSR